MRNFDAVALRGLDDRLARRSRDLAAVELEPDGVGFHCGLRVIFISVTIVLSAASVARRRALRAWASPASLTRVLWKVAHYAGDRIRGGLPQAANRRIRHRPR
jgi:hypothetical protein